MVTYIHLHIWIFKKKNMIHYNIIQIHFKQINIRAHLLKFNNLYKYAIFREL